MVVVLVLVKVEVASVPLCAGCGLEVKRDQFDSLPSLVAVGREVDGA